jgi:Tol biopolymer transport system component
VPTDPYPAVSPDGRLVAFAGVGPGGGRLWVHDIRTAAVSEIERTQDATKPAWSPDSMSLVYCAGDVLKTFDLAGRAPGEIDAPGCRSGVSWSESGDFLYGTDDGLWRVTAAGSPQRVTRLDPATESRHQSPCWLPGGREFVFLVRSLEAGVRGIYLGNVDGRTPTRLTAADTAPIFVQGDDGVGRLLFVRGATLVSQRLNRASRALDGEPVVLGERVAVGATVRDGAYAASPTLLAFRSEGAFQRASLTWFDREGRNLGVVEAGSALGNLSLSPDQQTLASERYNLDTNRFEVWLTDLARNVARPLRVMPYGVGSPLWAPDGTRLAFVSTETGVAVPFELTLAGEVRPLLRSPGVFNFLSDWSADGRWILGVTASALALIPADGSADPAPLVEGGAAGRLSPDGRWLAYGSQESGTPEIYVQRFPDGAQRTRVSTNGGVKPSWGADGRELFYRSERSLMAVDVRTGDRLDLGAPHMLFAAPFVPGFDLIPFYDYVVTRDGQRFLIATALHDRVAPLTAVVNWTS